MREYQITVKPWMLKNATPDFDFMAKFNNDIPMPLMVMYTGGKLDETKRMIKFNLHGDIKQRITTRCMVCGQILTNPVSQYFGIGPVCGGHNYTHPFDTDEELNNAVAAYRSKLVNTKWSGWIPVSAIISIDDITNIDEIKDIIDNMPIEIDDTPVFGMTDDTTTIAVDPKNIIRARIDKPVQGTDDFSVFLSFKYNPRLSEIIKEETRVHIWDKDAREWEIEYREFAKLQALLPEIGYSFNVTGTDLLPARIMVEDSYEFKTKPMSHQVAGVQYGLDHSRWLLADDQGLGKTKQLIDLALIRKNTNNFNHCLIICGVNSLKWNWLEEIEKHSNETGWILGMKKMKRSGKWTIGSNADKIADIESLSIGDTDIASHYFIITNVESLRDTAIAEGLQGLCANHIINMVAIDEVHRCKNLKTKQGQGMLQLQPDFRVAMTGTPLINTPLDLYAILNWLGYQRYSFNSFKSHFCRFDEWGSIIGYKNIDQLRDQLDSIMLRRTKEEVLDLPDKVYTTDYVELTDEQRKLYNQVIDSAIASEGDDNECILATKLRLRQVAGGIGPFDFIKKNPKLDRLEQIVEEAVYSGTKVIVYSNWVEGIKPALARLQKYNPVVITGETKDSDRQVIVNKFQEDPNTQVILGTIGALGTGLTLTAATVVVFLDNPWNNATKEQACDRAYRIGTTSTVTIHTIMAHGTYDEDVQAIIDGKKVLSDTIVEKKDLAKLKI